MKHSALTQASFQELTQQEWLLTNGLGGYASSTICGTNTRRYHGLLVAAFNPPTDRRVLVSKIEETLTRGEERFSLSSNYYPGVVYPQGYSYLESFERYPFPKTVFAAGTTRISKTVMMPHGTNTVLVEYANLSADSLTLELNPLLVYRDYHSLFRENDYFDFYTESIAENQYKVYAHYGATPFYVGFSGGTFVSGGNWFRRFEYPKELYRGLEYQEDAKSLGTLAHTLKSGEKLTIAFSTEENALNFDPENVKTEEIKRQNALKEISKDKFTQDLALSGDQFLVKRKSSNTLTVLAGYHWFTDWGRDTMIAMRGLTIAQGKKETSESIIRTFLKNMDQGMLPNRFPDQGEAPEYNTIDATLWLFVVLHEYYAQFGDKAFMEEVYPKLTEIIQAYSQGTRYNIHENEEGLIYGGEDLAQLTWMDAKVGDYVVTPRHGCPVEINALWYNALNVYRDIETLLDKPTTFSAQQIKNFRKVFLKYFLNDKGYLNDVVIPGDMVDDHIRPNQLYALSLPFPLLTGKQAKEVLDVVEKHLYTDLGIRSLSPDDQNFVPYYGGDQWHRDTAYHQGTVWAFLWGEYALAYLQAHKYSKKSQREILEKMKAFEQHFYHAGCLGGIAEIFDGATPQESRGCIQQGWSIGMLLKVLLDMQAKAHKQEEVQPTNEAGHA